jgi:uncharacterized membrane protein
MGTGGMWMAFGWVLGLLLLVSVVIAVVALIDVGARDRGALRATRAEQRSAAEDELELRYVRGEVDAASFVQQRAVLRQR